MARVASKPTARRCATCGKFLSATSVEDRCESCLSREADAAAAGETAAREVEVTEAPMPPRPEPSWPPRAPTPSVASSLPQLPPIPPVLEPGVVIPRPSQLHPTAANPIRAALDAPKPAPAKRSRWRLLRPKAGARPAPKPMQAVRRTTPVLSDPVQPPPQHRLTSGIVQPLAAPEPSQGRSVTPPTAAATPLPPLRPASGIVLPLAAAAPARPAPEPEPPAATPVMASPEPVPIDDAAAWAPRRSFAPSRAGVMMWVRVAIAVAIGLGAGLMVPFLLSR